MNFISKLCLKVGRIERRNGISDKDTNAFKMAS